jgi:hypothetical protein
MLTMLLGLVLLTFVASAHAQSGAIQALQNSVRQLQDQLKAVTAQLQVLQAQQAAQQTPTAKPEPALPGVAPAPAAVCPKPCWANVATRGYFQSRLDMRAEGTNAAGGQASTDFRLRRMYIDFIVTPNDRTTGVVEFERAGEPAAVGGAGDPAITLTSCYVDYKLNCDWDIMTGQVPNAFGWDEVESSSQRLPLERAAVIEGFKAFASRPSAVGLYPTGPWDRGVYLSRRQQGELPQIVVGALNGESRSMDADDNKTLEGDLRWKHGVTQYGVSGISGHSSLVPGTLPSSEREAIDIWGHRDPAPWGFQGEYVSGRDLTLLPSTANHPIRGWYGQVDRACGKGLPFVRYEQYNQDLDAPFGVLYHDWHLGYIYKLDANNKLTFETNVAGLAGTNMDWTGLQWQLGF